MSAGGKRMALVSMGSGPRKISKKSYTWSRSVPLRKALTRRYSIYRNMKTKLYPFENRAELLVQVNCGNTGNYGLATFQIGQMTATPSGAGVSAAANSLTLFTTLANFYSSVAGAGVTGVAYSSVTEYTNLFDLYRIDEWQLDIMYNSNDSTVTGGVNTSLPIFYAVEDLDDTSVVSQGQLFQYAGMRRLQFGNSNGPQNGHQYFTVKRPAVQTSALTTAGTAISQIQRGPWLSTAQSGVEHLGIKLYYDNPNQNAAASAASFQGYLTIISRIRFTCKETR